MAAYGMRGTPTLCLIDAQARLRANVFGRPTDLAVGAAIAALVAESARPLNLDGVQGAASSGCDETGCRL